MGQAAHQQYLLVGRLPERTDLLFFVAESPDLLFDGKGNQRFEVGSLGITASCFPLPHRFF